MGLRETMNQKPAVTAGIAAAAVILLIAGIIYSMNGPALPSAESEASRQLYFSDDDGATKFADKADKVPPFDHSGKQAVRARVFTSGGKEFINHLERYTPDGKQKFEEMNSKGTLRADPTKAEAVMRNGMEVKAPHAKDWTKLSDPKAMEIMRPKAPGGGSSDDLQEVFP